MWIRKMREIKIKDGTEYPNGQWMWIAYQSEKDNVDDMSVYYYVNKKDVNLSKIKVGDKIELDMIFDVVGVDGVEQDENI